MTHKTSLGLLTLGLLLGLAGTSEARPRCRPGWDQGYGCYFAAPYVGTGRYCAGFGYTSGWSMGPSTYYGPAPVSYSVPATSASGAMTTPAPVPATAPTPAPAPAPAPAADPTLPPAPAPSK